MDSLHTFCIMAGVTAVGCAFCCSSCESNVHKYAAEQKKEEMLMIQHMAAQGLLPHYNRMTEIDGWTKIEKVEKPEKTEINGEKQ